ncbi:MFS transporter [Spirillospora sp. NPDC048819]|uniref:MFS transporter n=1 Tax=Spirillospora sp. NPDC048819 TaxID=3155268 RepID=UPI0034020CDE
MTATAAHPAPTLLLACLLGGSAGWSMTAPGAAASTMATAYGAGLLWVGLLTAALAAPYAALQFPGGVLVDRLGVRTAATAGLSLVVAAHLAALLAPLPWLAVAARIASGTGFAVCFVAGAELARDSGRGSWGMGIFGGVALAASGAAVLVVPFAELVLDWRAPWVTTAAVAALALALTARQPPDGARGAAGPQDAQPAGPPSSKLSRDGQMFRLTAVHAVTLGVGLILSSWATTLLVDIWSFKSTAAAVIGSGVLGLSVVSRPLGGQVAAMWPTRNRMICVLALIACSAATLALSRPGAPVVAILAVVVLGLFSGLPFASVVGAAQARQPRRPAAAVGMMNTAAFGLVVMATPAVGWAADHGHASWTLVVVALLWLVPLLALPAAAAAQPGAVSAS